MTNKSELENLVEDFKESIPGRKNGDQRILLPHDAKLVELLRKIVASLPE